MARDNGLNWRVATVYVLAILMALAVIVKALYIQIVQGEKWLARVEVRDQKTFEVAPDRGNIYAGDGRLLVASVPYFRLHFDPFIVAKKTFDTHLDELAKGLAAFFRDEPWEVYRKRLWNARYGKRNLYVPLAPRRVNHAELRELKKLPILRMGDWGGLIVEQEDERVAPYKPLARRTLGFLGVGQDAIYRARVGLEEAYDADLKGKPGVNRRQMMSGEWVPLTLEEPVHGFDVVTTLDVDYQDIVHRALLGQLEKFRADGGTAVLMEVKTGDIKAIANLSRVGERYDEVYNRAIGEAAEPGSIFKAAVMLALLEDGRVHPDDTVDLGNGEYTYSGRTLHESSRGHVGKVTVRQVFERSLNGISQLVHAHYATQPERFIDRLYDMQLNKPLEVEIKGEGIPLIKYPGGEGWSGITLPWMSIGYEVKLTPLQLLAFYNALANDGKRMRPRFVKEIRDGSEVVRRVPTEVVDRSICSKETLRHLRMMMEGVVENGTARNLSGTSYGIAGKTGTAWIADRARGYQVRKYRASFVGYFPAKEPQFSCIVVVENPSQSVGYYGNVVSGSVFREIADKVYALAAAKNGRPAGAEVERLPVSKNGYKEDFLTLYDALGIRVNEGTTGQAEWVLTSRGEEDIALQTRTVDFSVVPNARGMGLRDALYVLENSGLKVGVSGSGMVVKQTIEPGRKVARGSYIHIELK